jgi:hypothetical protein
MLGKAEEEVIAVTMGDDENAARRLLGGARRQDTSIARHFL